MVRRQFENRRRGAVRAARLALCGVPPPGRWMALFFAAGSACFLIGPFPGYVQLVGEAADAITFFVGSILFTAGGSVQTWLATPDREASRTGRAAWRVAVIQFIGTL